MTTTNTSQTTSNTTTTYKTEYGWECPRCGRINAPWVRQCDCSRSYWCPTWTSDKVYVGDKPEWWRDYVTCKNDTFKIHPETDSIYTTGGSDYKVGDTYVNVSGTQSSGADSNVTAWNTTNPNNCYTPHYTTPTGPNNICSNH